MAVTDADKRTYLRDHVASDLQYVWDDSEVPLDLQYRMAQHYKSLRVFTAIAETTTEVRAAIQADFALDPRNDAGVRAQIAKVVSAWTAGKELYTKEKELQAETKVLGMPRNLQHSERLAMIKAVEGTLGTLSDTDVPSSEYLALKTEECESGEIVASPLDEITSKSDRATSALQTSLDTSGHVRVTKTKTKGKMPESTEEYRRALRLEAVTWLCMASKFKSKHWLNGLKMEDFAKFVDFILGDKVNGIKVPLHGLQHPLKPNWALVLQYEHRLRKEAFKLVNRGEKTLAEAFESVTKDSELKESYFITPLALTSSESSPNSTASTSGKSWGHRSFKGGNFGKSQGKSFGKVQNKFGKGKSKGGGKAKGKHGSNELVSKTPDGREICFAYNSQGCSGRCGRLHVCRVRGCYAEHAAREHDKVVEQLSGMRLTPKNKED